MSNVMTTPGLTAERRSFSDVGFAAGVIVMLLILFIPLPAVVLDFGLAFSIALSIVVLMVALWIEKPLQFSSFPTLLLLVTMLRLSLNVATTRLILTDGPEGYDAAGYVVAGFSGFVMSGDFVIGIVVFLILLIVNFLVITKGASRIAEVGARFALDAMPGKQMAIDADLSSGLIDETQARNRRKELEEESAFYGSMDGASKFVRGDAIAGLVITAINIVGGIIIGLTRHGMELEQALDIFTRLSVGDGLVSQIPALIVSLAAGLLISKGRNEGSANTIVFGQLVGFPRAIFMASGLVLIFALTPGLPTMPFLAFGLALAGIGLTVRRRLQLASDARVAATAVDPEENARETVNRALEVPDIELRFGQQAGATLLANQSVLTQRVNRIRQRFAEAHGFIIPEIKISSELSLQPMQYQIRMHATALASGQLRAGDTLIVIGDREPPRLPMVEAVEPAFGLRAGWIPETLGRHAREAGFVPVDHTSVVLTHMSEVLRANLAQLFTYRHMQAMISRLPRDYHKLLDEIVPQHITHSGIQAVLKALLSDRVSVRNFELILEAVAEVAPQVRTTEQIVENVRVRLGQQICGDLADNGVLKVVRLGPRWDLAFHEALRRDAGGKIRQLDMEPKQIQVFGEDARRVLQPLFETGASVAVTTSPEIRPYVRMIIERVMPSVAVISHAEIAGSFQLEVVGSFS